MKFQLCTAGELLTFCEGFILKNLVAMMDVKNFRDVLFNNNGQDVSALYFDVQFGTYFFLSQWCLKKISRTASAYSQASNQWAISELHQFQSEVKYETIDVKMVFYSYADKTHFHKKGFVLSLVLKVRASGSWLGNGLFIRGISELSMILSLTLSF